MQNKVEEFITKHNISLNDCDIPQIVDYILKEMSTPGSSMPMIESYCKPVEEVKKNEKVIVIDAGGTNFRTCTIYFDDRGKPVVENFRRCSMPGIGKEVSAKDFYSKIADETERLIDMSDRIGFCFSYPAKITEDHDGLPMSFSKEIRAKEVVGKPLGKNLLDELAKRGHDVSKKKIIIMNDTVTTLLAGISEMEKTNCSGCVGFILGTGTNAACLKNGSIINEESGNLDLCLGDIDKAFVAKTDSPDRYHFEKMISGAYLGKLAHLVIKTAAEEGVFSEGFVKQFETLPEIDTIQLSNFLVNQPSDLDSCISVQEDSDNLNTILDTFIDRTSVLVASNLAASVLASDNDGTRPVLINADGTTFYKTVHLMEYTKKHLDSYLAKKGMKAVLTQVENSPAVGAAIGALSL